MKDYSKPAFPSGNEVKLGDMITGGHAGMTLRDYFAAQAMQGLLACSYPVSELGYTMKNGKSLMENSAIFSYEIADAMLVERAA